jgi:hypothetical protein
MAPPLGGVFDFRNAYSSVTEVWPEGISGGLAKPEIFGSMDSFACGCCGKSLFGAKLGFLRLSASVTGFAPIQARPPDRTRPQSTEGDGHTSNPIDRINASPLLFVTMPARNL